MVSQPKIYLAGHRGMVGSFNEVAFCANAPCGADFSMQRSTEVDPTKSMPQEVSVVRIAQRYFRPAEIETLLCGPSKAKQQLGWVPSYCSRIVLRNGCLRAEISHGARLVQTKRLQRQFE